MHILQSAARCDFAVPAYCFMPHHVHLLVQGRAECSDLREFARLAKQTSAFAYARANGGARLWQPSYYDRALRDDESSLWVMAYILRNPVAAGLVQRWDEYPFIGSATHPLLELVAMLRQGLGPRWESGDVIPGWPRHL